MKKIFGAAFLAVFLFASNADAQTVKKVVKGVEHETAEVGSKGYAKIKDKSYKGKQGPHGETIYIDKYSHYYYVDQKGKKIFLKKAQLRNKP